MFVFLRVRRPGVSVYRLKRPGVVSAEITPFLHLVFFDQKKRAGMLPYLLFFQRILQRAVAVILF